MKNLSILTDDNHENPKDSQLIIVATGKSSDIRAMLQEIIDNIDKYGKPIQGTEIHLDTTISIITPVWKGLKY